MGIHEMQPTSIVFTQQDYDDVFTYLSALDHHDDAPTPDHTDHHIDPHPEDNIADDEPLVIPTMTLAQPPRVYKNTKSMLESEALNRFLVRTEYPYNHFLAFDSDEHFISYMNSCPEAERCFHEVIIGNPRALMVDIDDFDTPPSDYKSAGANIVDTFITAFNEYYTGLALIDRDDIVVISACGHSAVKDKDKFSYQIRTGMWTTTGRENLEFAKFFASRLPRPEIVDLGIYTDYHCMRIPGCTKKDDARPSKIISGHNLSDSWVGYNRAWGLKLPNRLADEKITPPPSNVELAAGVLDRILKMAEPYSAGYRVRRQCGSRIIFTRVGVSPECDLCGRRHDSDNTFFLSINGPDVMRGCWRCPGKLMKIGEVDPAEVKVTPSPAASKPTPAEKFAKMMAAPLAEENLTGDGYSKTEYESDTMQPYPKCPTLVVRAGKGVGKTEALVRHIAEHYAGRTIVAVTHRESFASELSRQLPGFTIYKDIKQSRISVENHSRIIIQMESLHRLDISEVMFKEYHIDLLILDESESILSQLSSRLFKNFNQAWVNFDWLTKYAEGVIALDAHISDRTLDLLRGREGKKLFIDNTYRRPGCKYVITPDPDEWYRSLSADLESGKRIVIPTNSATEARGIEVWVKEKYPAKSIKVYTGETERAIKSADIKNIAAAWKVDVLIYSPTITSGVSFKEKHFDRVYGFFRAGSAPAAECDQMLGRVRDIADGVGVIYIDPRATEGRLTKGQLRRQVMSSRSQYIEHYDTENLQFEYGKDTISVMNERYFNIWLDNAIVVNRSRAGLARELINMFKSSGVSLEMITPADKTGQCARVEVTAAKEKVIEAKYEAVVAAADIDDQTARRARENLDLPKGEAAQLHKYYLAKMYDVPTSEITVEWCRQYDTPQAMGWYKSLKVINEVGFEKIQTQVDEPLRPREAAGGERIEGWDTYIRYDRHKVAAELVGICGFGAVNDMKIISREQLTANIRGRADHLAERFEHMHTLFRTRGRRPDFEKGPLKIALEFINSILHQQYGIKIGRRGPSRGDRDQYIISHFHPFQTAGFTPKKIDPAPRVVPAQPEVHLSAAELTAIVSDIMTN
jgi:hypothetical protein